MERYISESRKQTAEIAERFAKTVNKGDIICLNGDLGAGKTAFVSGFAKGLGYTGYVSSPTFAIVNEYKADIMIYHFDVYRINDIEEMYEIGIDDYLFSDGVCIIEWPERIRSLLGKDVININILKNESDENVREIIIDGK